MPKSDLQSTSLHDIQQTLRKGSTSPYQTQDLYSGSDLRKHVETAHAAYLISPQILPDEKTFTRGAVHVPSSQGLEVSAQNDIPNQGYFKTIPTSPAQGSPNFDRTSSAPGRKSVSGKGLYDISRLSLRQPYEDNPIKADSQDVCSGINPLKRPADGDSGSIKKLAQSQAINYDRSQPRRAKGRLGGLRPVPGDLGHIGGNLVAQSHTMHRKKGFYDTLPITPLNPGGGRTRAHDRPSQLQKIYDYDRRTHVFRPKQGLSQNGDKPSKDEPEDFEQPVEPVPILTEDRPMNHIQGTVEPIQADSVSNQATSPEPEAGSGPEQDPIPVMIHQPKTRDISYDQLVVEVKGIYAGLVMVEAKCIDVDEKQAAAALDKATARRTRPTDEQWKAQITLHKTLLHEHHDFFLASQHPMASLTLTRMAATYQMPARLWRHGIHAFLEVLRHRLPESLDHMLAFISIAYAMMTLLFETVPMFEDTWIECLGDLGRYRMAIEDNDMRDRDTFAGVSRFWYSKASYRNPHVGRLYHHLAILSRHFSLQQLSNYAKSLTCVAPFENTRGSIMTLFNPILNGKQSANLRAATLETKIIKAHALQFCNLPKDGLRAIVQEVRDGLLRDHVNKITSRFKEQGVFLAIANVAAILEYGVLRHDGTPRAIIWLALRDGIVLYEKSRTSDQISLDTFLDHSHSRQMEASPKVFPRSSLSIDDLTTKELEASSSTIFDAATLWSVCFTTALQSPHNNNYHPFLHVVFVFLWSLANIEKGITYVEGHVPWDDVCFFLNTFTKSEAMPAKVEGEDFPQPDEGGGRPLPEDYFLRGQMYSWWYFPADWFSKANLDDEERVLELPSMAAPRLERIRWLGTRIAAQNRWIQKNPETRKFEVTEYAENLTVDRKASEAAPSTTIDQDREMTDTPFEAATTLKAEEDKSNHDAPMGIEADTSTTAEAPSRAAMDLQEVKTEHPATVSWLQGNVLDQAKGPPSKVQPESWDSATKKIESIDRFDQESKISST